MGIVGKPVGGRGHGKGRVPIATGTISFFRLNASTAELVPEIREKKRDLSTSRFAGAKVSDNGFTV
jgi:hypothetical protein